MQPMGMTLGRPVERVTDAATRDLTQAEFRRELAKLDITPVPGRAGRLGVYRLANTGWTADVAAAGSARRRDCLSYLLQCLTWARWGVQRG